jgi:hypothetical protein
MAWKLGQPASGGDSGVLTLGMFRPKRHPFWSSGMKHAEFIANDNRLRMVILRAMGVTTRTEAIVTAGQCTP